MSGVPKLLVNALAEFCLSVTLVGSRVTCSPPPTDTDQDVLCLVRNDKIASLVGRLDGAGWVRGGSNARNTNMGHVAGFDSYTKGDINLLLTADDNFHRRFLAATSVAKHLNLLVKADRIALFQAVLYGNPVAASEDPFA